MHNRQYKHNMDNNFSNMNDISLSINTYLCISYGAESFYAWTPMRNVLARVVTVDWARLLSPLQRGMHASRIT